MPSNQNLSSHLNHAIWWSCWAAEAGDCCSKQLYKLLDVKHTHFVISFVSTSAKPPTAQRNGHIYEDTAWFQPIGSRFPSCLILSSWKTECHTNTHAKGRLSNESQAASVLLQPNRPEPSRTATTAPPPPLPRRAAPGSQRPRLCKGRAPRPAPLPPGNALTGPCAPPMRPQRQRGQSPAVPGRAGGSEGHGASAIPSSAVSILAGWRSAGRAGGVTAAGRVRAALRGAMAPPTRQG